MTNVSAVEKMAELMQQMEENSPRVAALQYCLIQLEAKCAALAAENAGLKTAIEKHADSYIMCGYCRTERDGKNDDVCEVLDSTPATDAFLAEVRASAVDEACLKISNAIVNCYQDELVGLDEAATICGDFASEVRKGVQS
ncbi:hypothetical protein ACEW9T_000349 [Enterobacter hormaechei]|uniref:hypothetical protein n=1 Tax=Enterobacter hormaechei TaxID=158836 RepID=UPI0013D4711E|nr:hypothetical protein [Enterobacter hormaechei]HBL6095983.1 hypothetical protein [Enterobacter hormaechei]